MLGYLLATRLLSPWIEKEACSPLQCAAIVLAVSAITICAWWLFNHVAREKERRRNKEMQTRLANQFFLCKEKLMCDVKYMEEYFVNNRSIRRRRPNRGADTIDKNPTAKLVVNHDFER